MIHKLCLYSLFLAVILLAISSCNKKPDTDDGYLDTPVCTSSFVPKIYECQVVGFYPEWEQTGMPVGSIPWDKLTRLIYCFAIPNSNGTFNTSSLNNTRQLVDSAHAHGVEIYFSIGGATGSEYFPVLAKNEESRTRFVKEVKQYLFENCLDGVDIDWEYWSGYETNTVIPAESNALVTMLNDLKHELSPYNLGISVDVGAGDWGGKHFLNEIMGSVDFLQVMSYDFTGPWSTPGPHSSYEDAIGSGSNMYSTGLAYWVNYRLWPREKVLLGVPFYGRDFNYLNGEGVAYSQIVEQFPEAYLTDRVDDIYYDGISTMARKTQYVVDNKYSGIMIWEISQDSHVDSVSLLNSIYKVLHP
jgi:chitinase